MRALIFYDARHQKSAADVLARALENELGAEITFAGPGPTDFYFGLLPAPPEKPRKISILACARSRLRAYLSLAARQQRRIRAAIRARLRRIFRTARIIIRRKLGYKGLRYSDFRRKRTVIRTQVRRSRPISSWKRLFLPFIPSRRNFSLRFAKAVKRSYESSSLLFWNGVPDITLSRYFLNLHRSVASGFKGIYRDHGMKGVLLAVVAGPFLLVRTLLALDILHSFRVDRNLLKDADTAVAASKADLLIVLEDNAEGLTGTITHAARRARIPFLVVPDYIPNPLEPARFYYDSPDHRVLGLRSLLVARLLPHWKLSFPHQSMLRLPPRRIISQKLLGADRPQPWVLNSGYTAAITIESRAMKSHYLSLGFIEGKLKTIGSPRDDILWDAMERSREEKDRLTRSLGLDAGRPTVLCSFPPDQYGPEDTQNTGFEFASYDALLRGWFEVLGSLQHKVNVLIKPHPRLGAERLMPFANENIRISTAPTETLLPLADLYVASVSTTIRWALALGIPVINYDTYGYRYGDFSTAKGMVEVFRVEDFDKALRSLVLDEAAASELRHRARSDAETWGLIDGKFGSRFVGLTESVVTAPRTFRSSHPAGWRLPDYSDPV